MFRKYKYEGTDDKGRFIAGVTDNEHDDMGSALKEIHKVVHSTLSVCIDEDSSEENKLKVALESLLGDKIIENLPRKTGFQELFTLAFYEGITAGDLIELLHDYFKEKNNK